MSQKAFTTMGVVFILLSVSILTTIDRWNNAMCYDTMLKCPAHHWKVLGVCVEMISVSALANTDKLWDTIVPAAVVWV